MTTRGNTGSTPGSARLTRKSPSVVRTEVPRFRETPLITPSPPAEESRSSSNSTHIRSHPRPPSRTARAGSSLGSLLRTKKSNTLSIPARANRRHRPYHGHCKRNADYSRDPDTLVRDVGSHRRKRYDDRQHPGQEGERSDASCRNSPAGASHRLSSPFALRKSTGRIDSGLRLIAHHGARTTLSFRSLGTTGARGSMNGTPNDSIAAKWARNAKTPTAMPYKPRIAAKKRNANLSNLAPTAMLNEGVAKDATPVPATTITMIDDTEPDLIAASPNTSTPTILTAGPTSLGRRMPASRTTSNVSSIIRASDNAGKGIPSHCAAILSINGVGRVPW